LADEDDAGAAAVEFEEDAEAGERAAEPVL